MNLGDLLLYHVKDSPRALEAYAQAGGVYERLSQSAPAVLEFRSRLAASYTSIANAHRRAGQPEKAEPFHIAARKIGEELVRLKPDYHPYHSELGALWNNYALFLRNLKRHDEELAAIDQAITCQSQAVNRAPSVKRYHKFLATHYYNKSIVSRRLGKLQAAMDACREGKKFSASDPLFLFDFTLEMARSLKAFEAATAAATADKNKLAGEAVETLQQAVQAGFKDLAKLKSEAELSILRSRADFKKVVEELEKKLGTKRK